MTEFMRIMKSRKILLVTVLLLAGGTVIFAWNQFQTASAMGYSFVQANEYRQEVQGRCRGSSPEEALQWVQQEREGLYAKYGDDGLLGRLSVLEEEEEVLKKVLGYPEYLQGIWDAGSQLEGISIFQNADSHALENLEKTERDYRRIEDVQVVYGNYKALAAIFQYDGLHYIIFLFLCVIVFAFFDDEKLGLKSMIYASANGRGNLCLQRVGALAIASVGFVVLSYLLLALCSFGMYGGWADLGAPVQSLPLLSDSALPLSAGGYLLCYVVFHGWCAFVLGLFLWAAISLLRSRILSVGIALLAMGAETLLYFQMTEQSPNLFLRYENLYCLLRPDGVLGKYRNYLHFGHLVNGLPAFLVFSLVLSAVCAAAATVIGIRRKTVFSRGRLGRLLLFALGKGKRAFHMLVSRLPVFGAEIYKILVTYKGWLFIAVWAWVVASGIDTGEAWIFGSGAWVKEVYGNYSGPDDGRLERYLQEEQQKIDDILREYEEAAALYEKGEVEYDELFGKSLQASATETAQAGIDSCRKQLDYIRKVKQEQGIDAWFINNKGYRVLWGSDGLYMGQGYKAQERDALLSIAVLVFLIGFVFSYDRSCGVQPLIWATAGGREKLFWTKVGAVFTVCLLVYAGTYGARLYEVQKMFPLGCLSAPVQSLMFMEGFPLRVSCGGFLAIMGAIHLVMLFAVAMLICLVTVKVDGVKGILLSFVPLVPAVLAMLGMDWMKYLSVIEAVIYVRALQEHGFVYSLAVVFVVLGLGIFCCMKTRQIWCQKGKRR